MYPCWTTNAKMFKKRNLLIATKHEKEKVIAPILEKKLGVKCFVTSNFDTDELGTFSGEVERKDNPIATARNKCLLAMELTNCDLAVASEGSFGPHPNAYFVSSDDECLLFLDKKNNLEIVVRELSIDTNFSGTEIKTYKELKDFAFNAKFPSHGLILRKSKDDFTDIVKGITNAEHLKKTFEYFISNYAKAFVETDMRAMYNPTRMTVIKNATKKLADKINTLCPECKTPGFEVTNTQKGLPCKICSFPTRSTLSYFYSCKKCSYTKEKKYPNNKYTEDPMYCDLCNP